MAGLSLAALSLLGSLAATGIGAAGSASANAAARQRLENDAEEDRRYYNRLLNRDYVDSPENAGLLRRLQELQRERYNQARATNVVAGGTDAHLAAMQGSANDVVTRTAQGIAERSQQYKDNVASQKRASEKAHSQQMFGLDQQKAQTVANAAGQATKAMAGIAAAAGTPENPFGLTGPGYDWEGDAQATMQDVLEKSMEASFAYDQEQLLRPYNTNVDNMFHVDTIKKRK